MDIGVKERVIGAVVLVVLGIIIIPWVLEGPAPDRSVTKDVPLPAAGTTSAPAEYRMPLAQQADTPATSPASPATAPAGNNTAPASQASRTPPPAPSPQHTRPIARQSEAPAGAPTGKWMVQAGSYSSEHNAIKLQRALEKHGYPVVVSRYSMGKRTYYRVRVGPYQDPAEAHKVIPDINRIYGGKAKVVPNS